MSNDWNIGQKANKGLKTGAEEVVLVGLIHKHQTEAQVSEYLDELAFLAETAGAKTRKRFVQKLKQPDSRTFVGSGKLQEIADYIESHENIVAVIFDDDLSGKTGQHHRKVA